MLTFLAAYVLVFLAVGAYLVRLAVTDRRLARAQVALKEPPLNQAGQAECLARAA
jgi:hypothetical protein